MTRHILTISWQQAQFGPESLTETEIIAIVDPSSRFMMNNYGMSPVGNSDNDAGNLRPSSSMIATESQRLYNSFVGFSTAQSMTDLGYMRHVTSNIHQRLYNNERFSDIAFQVSKREFFQFDSEENVDNDGDYVIFYGIKALFACQSPVLERYLYSDMNRMFTIKLDGISSESFDFLMKYCYGLNPILTIKNVSQILHCSEKYSISELSKACVHYLATQMVKWDKKFCTNSSSNNNNSMTNDFDTDSKDYADQRSKLRNSNSNNSNSSNISNLSNISGNTREETIKNSKILLLLLPFIYEFDQYKIAYKLTDILDRLFRIGKNINKFDIICMLNDQLFIKIPSINILGMLYKWIDEKFNLSTIDLMTNNVNLRLNDQLWKCTLNWYNHNKYHSNYHFKDIKPLLSYVDLSNLTIINSPSNSKENKNVRNNMTRDEELKHLYMNNQKKNGMIGNNHMSHVRSSSQQEAQNKNDAFLQRIFKYKSSMANDELSVISRQIHEEMIGDNMTNKNNNNNNKNNNSQLNSISEINSNKNKTNNKTNTTNNNNNNNENNTNSNKTSNNNNNNKNNNNNEDDSFDYLRRKRKRRVDRRHLIKPSVAKKLAKERNSARNSRENNYTNSNNKRNKRSKNRTSKRNRNSSNTQHSQHDKNKLSFAKRQLILSNVPSLDIKRYSLTYEDENPPLRQDEIERLKYDETAATAAVAAGIAIVTPDSSSTTTTSDEDDDDNDGSNSNSTSTDRNSKKKGNNGKSRKETAGQLRTSIRTSGIVITGAYSAVSPSGGASSSDERDFNQHNRNRKNKNRNRDRNKNDSGSKPIKNSRDRESLDDVNERMKEIQNEMRNTLNVASRLALEKTPDIDALSDMPSDDDKRDGDLKNTYEQAADKQRKGGDNSSSGNSNSESGDGGDGRDGRDLNSIHLQMLEISNNMQKQQLNES